MLLWTSGHLLGFLCVLMMRTPGVHHHAVQNDATESLDAPVIDTVQDGDVPMNNQSVNRARNGGRQRDDAPRKGGLTQSQVGCRELRSTKYISDGMCTSINPIKELVCAGECLPSHLLPNWIGTTNNNNGGSAAVAGGKYWSVRDAQEWRCVIDRTRTQRIRLQCQDGSSRTYKITVVTSCKCKRYSRQQNDSSSTGHKTEGGGGGVRGGGGKGSKDQSRSSKRKNKEQRKAGLPEDWAEEQS